MSYYDIPSLYVPIKWRRHPDLNRSITVLQTAALPLGYAAVKKWSGRTDSNRRRPPWQGGTLPLSYARFLNSNCGGLNIIYELFCQQKSYRPKVAGGDGNATVFFLKPALIFYLLHYGPSLLYEHCVLYDERVSVVHQPTGIRNQPT